MAKRRPLESGYCQAGNHRLCWHKLQEGNDRRPELWCACKCHPALSQP